MEWHDQAVVLGTHPYGERLIIVDLLTENKGIWRGAVSISHKSRHILQPGCLVKAQWKARLVTQLGRFTVEILSHPTYLLFQSALGLETFNAACALILQIFPQQEPAPSLFPCFNKFLLEILKAKDKDKTITYLLLEKDILTLSGFSLDLTHCAVTGQTNDLMFVSPKTGRAVCQIAAEPYKNRLLYLPRFFLNREEAESSWSEIAKGFLLTGHFLQSHLLISTHKGFPPARLRLKSKIDKFATQNTGFSIDLISLK
jgi:DNA repair protein RecO (recombination protein O)